MTHETVIVLDFGGQYRELIARRVRESHVFCRVLGFDAPIEEIRDINPKGIILTGGPSVVTGPEARLIDPAIFNIAPVLGICYGAQLIGHILGGKVAHGDGKEYGKATVGLNNKNTLFEGIHQESVCWMSHTYQVTDLPEGFRNIGRTDNCFNAAFAHEERKIYGVQFHPEVVHTEGGEAIIKNFLYKICGCQGDWVMADFALEEIKKIKEKVGGKKVLCALSGGVDSSVAAVMVSKAIGKNLTCILVDHGLMRKNEADQVEKIFREQFDINLIRVNAGSRFLAKLKGVTDPETKRKIIGEEFIRVFEEEGKKIGAVDFLCQGTIYPDIIESGTKTSAVIKSHHNVGGLPDVIDFQEIIEPLRDLFKDEVRQVGLALGIPENLVMRQPFPGPGLGIRVIGEITEEKLYILRETDYIFREEIKNAGLDRDIWQYFTVLTGLRSVGVMGDERTYSYTVALRAVTSIDAMTADWARIPWDVLERISNRLVNEAPHVNRIVYDITSKPPATIEWE